MSHAKILEQKFDTIDKNHDGKLDVREIQIFLVAFGFREQQARDFIKEFDVDKDGVISKQEFKKAVRSIQSSKFTETQLRVMFRKADKDKSGKVTMKELKDFLTVCGTEVSSTEIKEWVEENDKNKDKMLDYEEFLSFARKHL